jgi:hypothetical protein
MIHYQNRLIASVAVWKIRPDFGTDISVATFRKTGGERMIIHKTQACIEFPCLAYSLNPKEIKAGQSWM